MLLNIITGFLNLKTGIWPTEEFHLKGRLTPMNRISAILKIENSGASGNIFEMMMMSCEIRDSGFELVDLEVYFTLELI